MAQRKDAPAKSSDAEPDSTDFSASVFGGEASSNNDDWAAFGAGFEEAGKKPSRPPPPKPRAPR